MIIVRSVDARWLSNAWLVAAGPGEPAAVIDAGAPPEALAAAARERRLGIELVVLTHHHADHVMHRAAFAPTPVAMHALDAAHVTGVDRLLLDREVIRVGRLVLTMLHVPGHTRGQVNVLVSCEGEVSRVFTGDTLFRDSVGGTRAPGHGTFLELRHSILEVLLDLPGETIVHPGHGDDTTIARESERNPFVRAWRGHDPLLDEPCLAMGQPARLLALSRDYDGGTKAWVRWADKTEDTVPGSRVERSVHGP